MNEHLIAKIAYETLLRTGAPTGSREWQKIFAELIVRECAEVITETRWHLPPTQQQIAVGIKEHFGVNE